VTPGRAYSVEPWAVRETGLDLDLLARGETVFALSNGHIGLRGNLDEGEPFALPGTYLNAFYESRPLPYAESAYGLPEDGQTIVNVTNGKVIRLLVDDEQFDVRYGDLLRHERVLDLREGVMRREVEWRSPAGQTVRVRSTRLVSFVHRSVAAIAVEVEPVDGPARIVLQSELVANEPVPTREDDPRAAAALASPLVSEQHTHHGLRAGLVHVTRRSGLRMAAGMDHLVEGPGHTVTGVESEPDLARLTVTTELEPGQRLRMVKFLAYAWSSRRSRPSLRDQVDASLASARRTGWDGMRAEQREFLDGFWRRADVELEGDPELQQAMRFGMFQVLQAGARAERRAIPAKGLTGPGYDGHTFWDMDTFVLPVLTYTAPDAAGDALRWRHSVLDHARAHAALAHDPRPGVLRLLAGGHGGLPRERRHRRRGAALPRGHARRRLRAGGGTRAARRDGAALALPRAPRRRRRVPHRRRHGARRVQRHRRQQRLHQPHGGPEPGGGRRRVGPPPRPRRRPRRGRGGDGRLARRGGGDRDPL
jgi:alpha,alpha-trehalose phosphorylase